MKTTKLSVLFALSALAARCFAADAPVPLSSGSNVPGTPPIDRQALVSRHNVVLKQFDPNNPLSVGNGHFAFTVDATGLQTFPQPFLPTIPLCTMADWSWHSFPNPNGWTIDNYVFREYDSHGRRVPYADVTGRSPTAPADQRTQGANSGNLQNNYLRENPHRFNLGQVGFVLTKADGSFAQPADLSNVEQTLDLWNGTITSKFTFDGQPVEVQTSCNGYADAIEARVKSPLVRAGQLKIQIFFPYGSPSKSASDWTKPDAHKTTVEQIVRPGAGGVVNQSTVPNMATFSRQMDSINYRVCAAWSPGGTLSAAAPHQYVIAPARNADTFDFRADFTAEKDHAYKSTSGQVFSQRPGDIAAEAKKFWNLYWSNGGAVDLSLSKDARWQELERRIVLSQYLVAIQCAGDDPPQETGLTYNSWNGKFHLEMHWWHDLQFALWDRMWLFERSLNYYNRILPRAEATAKRQGYAGARWPKMTDSSGNESPSSVGPFLIWQEPHPIYYAEILYREKPTAETLNMFKNVVFETADFMASYPFWDEATKRYVLGPPLQGAQEIFAKNTTMNTTFEIAYWRWGLSTAQKWRERLGLPRVEKWDHVLNNLPQLPVEDDKYLFAETAPGTYTQPKRANGFPLWADDHPSVLGAFGMLPPTQGLDAARMKRTLDWVWDNWNWPDTWGWDYGMVAMCAARVDEPGRAVDALLLNTPKNVYLINGHNYQRSPDLYIYLPGNGSLLSAVAMMCAGWDGAPKKPAPGFPSDGQWTVRWENLRPMP